MLEKKIQGETLWLQVVDYVLFSSKKVQLLP